MLLAKYSLLICLWGLVLAPCLILGYSQLRRRFTRQTRKVIYYDFTVEVEAFLLFCVAIILDVHPIVSAVFSVLAILSCVGVAVGIIFWWARFRTRIR